MSDYIRWYEAKDISPEFVMRNDRIEDIRIICSMRKSLSLEIEWASGRQKVGGHYTNTNNIGYMLMALADIVLDFCDARCDTCDLISKLKGKPVRVAEKYGPDELIGNRVYIGHFMLEKFIRCNEWVCAGAPSKEVKEAK